MMLLKITLKEMSKDHQIMIYKTCLLIIVLISFSCYTSVGTIQKPDKDGMVLVKGGSFQLYQEVLNIKDFYIDVHEVTVTQFSQFVNATGYVTDAEKFGFGTILTKPGHQEIKSYGTNWRHDEWGNMRPDSQTNYPVVHVSWNDAVTYAKWAGKRLPTRLEYQYISKDYEDGDDDYAWNFHFDIEKRRLCPVGGKKTMEPGVYDVSGNVREWSMTFEATTSPIMEHAENKERGGSIYWTMGSSAFSFLSFHVLEGWMCANCEKPDLGFRCARDVNATPQQKVISGLEESIDRSGQNAEDSLNLYDNIGENEIWRLEQRYWKFAERNENKKMAEYWRTNSLAWLPSYYARPQKYYDTLVNRVKSSSEITGYVTYTVIPVKSIIEKNVAVTFSTREVPNPTTNGKDKFFATRFLMKENGKWKSIGALSAALNRDGNLLRAPSAWVDNQSEGEQKQLEENSKVLWSFERKYWKLQDIGDFQKAANCWNPDGLVWIPSVLSEPYNYRDTLIKRTSSGSNNRSKTNIIPVGNVIYDLIAVTYFKIILPINNSQNKDDVSNDTALVAHCLQKENGDWKILAAMRIDYPRIIKTKESQANSDQVSSKSTHASGNSKLKDSINYYQNEVEKDPSNISAHCGLASVLEYSGEYGPAVKEYQLVADLTKDKKQKADARVHLLTCKYLEKNAKKTSSAMFKSDNKNKPSIPKEESATRSKINVDTMDFSPKAISERSGWEYLKGLAASVTLAGGVAALKGDAEHIQYAVKLLDDWLDAPDGQSIQARNRFLAGMVSTLASIITKHNLSTQLGPLYNPKTSGMPESGYAGDMQQKFEEHKMEEEEKKVEVTDNLTFTEKQDVFDISGEYDVISSTLYPDVSQYTSGTRTQGPGVTTSISLFKISLSDNILIATQSTVSDLPASSVGGIEMGEMKITTESVGKAQLVNSSGTIEWIITTNSSGRTGNPAYLSASPSTRTERVTGTVRVLDNGDIELTTSVAGNPNTSVYRKISSR